MFFVRFVVTRSCPFRNNTNSRYLRRGAQCGKLALHQRQCAPLSLQCILEPCKLLHKLADRMFGRDLLGGPQAQ